MSKKYLNWQKAFTLLEIIVSISIIGIVGLILSFILTGNFRNSNKTAVLGNVKQNGQLAINLIDQTIKNSDAIICPPASSSTVNTKDLLLSTQDGKNIQFSICPQPANKSVNGSIAQAAVVVDPSTTDIPAFCSTLASVCSPSTNQITDGNKVSGVSVINGSFNITNTFGSKSIVNVQFDVGAGVSSPSTYDNQIGQNSQSGTNGYLHFNTSAQLR